MQIKPQAIPDVLLLTPKVYEDERGFFLETFQDRVYAAAGIPSMVQDNQSGSRQGVLRGLHFQVIQPQGKLVSVALGTVYDVVVDLRRSSPTFGRWLGTTLSSEVKRQLWVPPGFAHGFYVLSRWAEVTYKVTDYYSPAGERTLAWNDPALGIIWPLIDGGSPLLSAKDARGLPLSEHHNDLTP